MHTEQGTKSSLTPAMAGMQVNSADSSMSNSLNSGHNTLLQLKSSASVRRFATSRKPLGDVNSGNSVSKQIKQIRQRISLSERRRSTAENQYLRSQISRNLEVSSLSPLPGPSQPRSQQVVQPGHEAGNELGNEFGQSGQDTKKVMQHEERHEMRHEMAAVDKEVGTIVKPVEPVEPVDPSELEELNIEVTSEFHVSQIYHSSEIEASTVHSQPITKSRPPLSERASTGERVNNEISLNMSDFRLQNPEDASQVFTKRNFEFTSLLGRGGYSQVFAVKSKRSDHTEYALKVVDFKDQEDNGTRHMLEEEVRLLMECRNCEHVIQLIAHETTADGMTLLLERASGDLASMLSTRKKSQAKASIDFIRYWGIQVLEAVAEIHSLNIVHADLKPANFLLVGGSLKLCDFGISSNFSKNTTSVHRNLAIGTLAYMAPETLSTLDGVYRVTRASDIWSCGIILHEMAFHFLPRLWDESEPLELPDELYDGTSVPKRLHEVLSSCLSPNPKERPRASEALDLALFSPVGIDSASFMSFVDKVYIYGHTHGRQNRFAPHKVAERGMSSYNAFQKMHQNE